MPDLCLLEIPSAPHGSDVRGADGLTAVVFPTVDSFATTRPAGDRRRGRAMGHYELAETLACDASNVTELVDRLESRGLVRRRPSAADRRVKVLDLTPTGSRLRAMLLDRMTTPPATFRRLPIRRR